MKSVKLSRIYGETGKPVSELTFREPRWTDYIQLGEIYERQEISGAGIVICNYEALDAHARRCLQDHDASVILPMLDLTDALAVADVISGFFSEARKRLAAQTS